MGAWSRVCKNWWTFLRMKRSWFQGLRSDNFKITGFSRALPYTYFYNFKDGRRSCWIYVSFKFLARSVLILVSYTIWYIFLMNLLYIIQWKLLLKKRILMSVLRLTGGLCEDHRPWLNWLHILTLLFAISIMRLVWNPNFWKKYYLIQKSFVF